MIVKYVNEQRTFPICSIATLQFTTKCYIDTNLIRVYQLKLNNTQLIFVIVVLKMSSVHDVYNKNS